MEKSRLVTRKLRQHRVSGPFLLTVLLIGACAIAFNDLLFPNFNATILSAGSWSTSDAYVFNNPESFDWDTLTPSTDVNFHPCYDLFECARLKVPLDWNNQSSNSRHVAVALIKLPAKVHASDPRYGGSIILIPGGPGGSGVNLARSEAHGVQVIVDSPVGPKNNTGGNDVNDKYFDIISFDPRGTGFTTPAFICFPDAVQRTNWELASAAEGFLGSSSTAFSLMWARKQALADACYSRLAVEHDGEPGLAAYMNTPTVAMDIKAIVDGLTKSQPDSLHQRHTKPSSQVSQNVYYWGFSYGTLLGSTFAAMYPDSVGRMVLDGVMDAERYYGGAWEGSLRDADAIVGKFCEYCYEASPMRCALYSEKGPGYIHQLFNDLIASVARAPIPVPISSTRGPEIITHSDIQALIHDAVYSPLEVFEELAQVMLDISHRNGTLLADSKALKYRSSVLSPRCLSEGPYSPACFSPPLDAAQEVLGAVSCSDGQDQTNMTEAMFLDYLQRVNIESVYLGNQLARYRLFCIFWRVRPKVTWPGPIGGSTAGPILFISNTLDPVTSLENGIKMSAKFNGSRLLRQDSVGHVSSTTPSICTAKTVRHYFQTGELPKFGTICPVNERPFGLPGTEFPNSLEAGDEALLEDTTNIHNFITFLCTKRKRLSSNSKDNKHNHSNPYDDDDIKYDQHSEAGNSEELVGLLPHRPRRKKVRFTDPEVQELHARVRHAEKGTLDEEMGLLKLGHSEVDLGEMDVGDRGQAEEEEEDDGLISNVRDVWTLAKKLERDF